jgi:hypothetical protein
LGEVGALGVAVNKGREVGGGLMSERGACGDGFEVGRRGVRGITRMSFGRVGIGIGAIFGIF